MSQADSARDAIDARHKTREILAQTTGDGPWSSDRDSLMVEAQVWATLALSYELAAGRG